MRFYEAVRSCLGDNYSNFSGRAQRSEFWWYQLFNWLVITGGTFLFLALLLLNDKPNGALVVYLIVFGAVFLTLFVPSLSVSVRRFHDVDMSGRRFLGFFFLNMIPIVGCITTIIMIRQMAKEGTMGENRFGSDPIGLGETTAIPWPPRKATGLVS